MSITSANGGAIWLQLMETGVFDDHYPHRINACFHYLSEGQQNFSLKEFIQKAAYVFSYLGFDADKDSNFAAIDIFRTFDRSGTGQVALEDFLLGVIEHLYAIRRDVPMLESVADALLSVESRAIELSTLLEKGNNKNNKFMKFNANLGALSSIIRADIKIARKNSPVLNRQLLVAIFQRAITQTVSDLQTHFHLSSARLSTLLLTITPEEAAAEVQPLTVVWGVHPGKRAEEPKASKEGDTPLPHRLHSRSGSILQLGGTPEEVLAQFLSSLDESRLKSFQQGSAVMGPLGPSDDSLALLAPIVDAMDSNKLYLLQQAFDSLNNFFTLYQSIAGDSATGTKGGGKGGYGAIGQNLVAPPLPSHAAQQPAEPPSSQDLQHKLQEYRGILHNNDADDSQASDVTQVMDGVEYLLAEDLFTTQSNYTNLSAKCRILEMIQADHLVASKKSLRMARDTSSNSSSSSSASSSSSPSRSGELSDELDAEGILPPESNPSVPTYEQILGELSSLGQQLSARTASTFPLGLMFEHPYTHVQATNTVFTSLYAIEQMCYEVLENVYKFQSFQFHADKLTRELQSKEQHIQELVHKQESVSFERNDLMTMGLELQILRDKLSKVNKDDHLHKLMETKNLELTRRVKELEEQVSTLQTNAAAAATAAAIAPPPPPAAPHTPGGGAKAASSGDHSSGGPLTGTPSGPHSDNDPTSSSTPSLTTQNINHLLHHPDIPDSEKIKKLTEYISSLHLSSTHLVKENNKFTTQIAFYEKRLKACISDQMLLHNNIYALEDEITSYKSTITKLTREIEEQRIARTHNEQQDKYIFTLQQEISKYKHELIEANNNLVLANKYHNDLIQAERTIEGLEHKLSEVHIELEKGQIAVAQLEGFREQLKQRNKEIRDMSLHIHGLETSLKEVPFLHQRYQDVLAELQEVKNKVEKVPGLLAEIARLRGSARASIKALSEQDKLLGVYKTRVKALEKETALLKHDNRALQDVENKLKEANNEVKRLMTALAEANQSNKGMMTPLEERKEAGAMINKKMQRYMRQSAFFATNPLSPTRGSITTPGPPTSLSSSSAGAEDSTG